MGTTVIADGDSTRMASLALTLGAFGLYSLLPRPTGRRVAVGIPAGVIALLALGFEFHKAYGEPYSESVGSLLFWLFSGVSLLAASAFVVQKNPARGAMAFAFVILGVSGLFLLLAAPFLMAANVVVYAGAIIVTFLFVLMLSPMAGPSDENDRTREPLLGTLAGFAFVGLTLLSLAPRSQTLLPTPPLTLQDRELLTESIRSLDAAIAAQDAKEIDRHFGESLHRLGQVIGSTREESKIVDNGTRVKISERFLPTASATRLDAPGRDLLNAVAAMRESKRELRNRIENALDSYPPSEERARAELRGFREELVLLAGRGQLPARNVAAIGNTLYAEQLIAVELAGTALLMATIGAIAISRKRHGGTP